jgi:hypothetical protein
MPCSLRFGSFAVLSLALAAAACGGNSAAPGPASPASPATDAATSGAPSAPAAGSSATPAPAPSSPSTTTSTLAGGGELQGAKLQQTSGSQATVDVAGGPGNGPHEKEPGRTQKDIQTIIQAHRDEARACYDNAQKAHPDATMKGNLDVKWLIDPTGKVTETSIDDAKTDIKDPGVQKCIQDVIKSIHFAVSGKGFETRAHYPFNFNPHNVPAKAQ